MEDLTYRFTSEMVIWTPKKGAAWHFIPVPKDDADHMRFFAAHLVRGFKSLKVNVTIGETSLRTSVFPSTDRGTYILPIKKLVRDREGLAAGDDVEVKLNVVE